MPRNLKEIESRIEKRSMAVAEVTCPRCGETWRLNPRKWKNINSILRDGRKKIHCPFCNKLVILAKETTKKVLEMMEYGKGIRKD